MRFSLVYLVIAITVLAGLTRAADLEAPLRPVSADFASTCQHYQNRARFKPREGPLEFVTILADSCTRAMVDLYARVDTAPVGFRRAAEYLTQLTALKRMVITMNVERAYGKTYSARSMPRARQTAHRNAPISRSVSPYGEYLIARDIGVIKSYRNWARVTGHEAARTAFSLRLREENG